MSLHPFFFFLLAIIITLGPLFQHGHTILMIFFLLVFLKDFLVPFNGQQKHEYVQQLTLHIIFKSTIFLIPRSFFFFFKSLFYHAQHSKWWKHCRKVSALNVVAVSYLARTKEGCTRVAPLYTFQYALHYLSKKEQKKGPSYWFRQTTYIHHQR